MNKKFIPSTPEDVRKPFGNYVHGIKVPAGCELIFTSGQLGVSKDDAIPEDIAEQATICFENISAVLTELGASFDDVFKVTAYVTDRSYFPDYMRIRDLYIESAVCSTLLIVSGFTRPEFKVEIEISAIKPAV